MVSNVFNKFLNLASFLSKTENVAPFSCRCQFKPLTNERIVDGGYRDPSLFLVSST